MTISPIDEKLIGPKLYLHKHESKITLVTIEIVIDNKGTTTKIIEELIRIARESDELNTIVIENILSPALKHMAVDKFKFTEDEYCNNTYALKFY